MTVLHHGLLAHNLLYLNVTIQNSTDRSKLVKRKQTKNLHYRCCKCLRCIFWPTLECHNSKFFSPPTMVGAFTKPLSNIEILPPSLSMKILPSHGTDVQLSAAAQPVYVPGCSTIDRHIQVAILHGKNYFRYLIEPALSNFTNTSLVCSFI